MTNSDVVSLLMNSQYYKQGYKQGVSDTLDKIRAEIDNALSDGMIHKKTVLGIIDKYKAESEDEK